MHEEEAGVAGTDSKMTKIEMWNDTVEANMNSLPTIMARNGKAEKEYF